MAKKKRRPTSTTAQVKAANRQSSTARQTAASSSASSASAVEPQRKVSAAQKANGSLNPPVAVEEEHSGESVTSKQVKTPSSSTSGTSTTERRSEPVASEKTSSSSRSAPSTAGTSAAERRRERVGSRKISSSSRSAPSAGEKRRRAVRKSWWQRYSLALIGGILLVVVIIVGTFFIIANSGVHGVNGPTDSSILKKVTSVKQSVLASVNTGGIQNVLQHPGGNPTPLTGPTGKPEVFFYGAEFCPYCAAERWSAIVALSRFGTFTQLPLIVSSEDSISTFTFHGSKYSSDYVDFVPVEAEDGSQQVLESPTADQQQLLKQYNVTGFPFIDIANDYIATNAIIADPTQLEGLSQQDIANKLSDPKQPITQEIVGGANYFTAAICLATNNQPASVCNSAPIPSISSFLTSRTFASVSATTPLSVTVESCPGELATCRKRGNV